MAAARAIVPWFNRGGASNRQLETAIELLEAAPAAAHAWPMHADRAKVADLDSVERLAIEMISNEELERRAMEGEFHLLEEVWRDAEEIAAIAAIADDLLVPPFVESYRTRGANSYRPPTGSPRQYE